MDAMLSGMAKVNRKVAEEAARRRELREQGLLPERASAGADTASASARQSDQPTGVRRRTTQHVTKL